MGRQWNKQWKRKFWQLLLILLPMVATAQRVVTVDPEHDPIARRSTDGTLQLTVPAQALATSIQEAIPQITDIQSIGIQKIGKSSYMVASGRERHRLEAKYAVAILLVETSPGVFQSDNLVLSCCSTGDCRECSLPPVCNCNKGEGSCGQNSAMVVQLKKATVTLFD